MREITASEAARSFSAMLDQVEQEGASFIIVRRGKPVAEIRPVGYGTAGALKAALSRHPADPEWMDDIRSVRALLTFDLADDDYIGPMGD